MKNSALVVIDLQNDITKNYREIIGKVNEAIDWAAQRELWVIYIQHNNLSLFLAFPRRAGLLPVLPANRPAGSIERKTQEERAWARL